MINGVEVTVVLNKRVLMSQSGKSQNTRRRPNIDRPLAVTTSHAAARQHSCDGLDLPMAYATLIRTYLRTNAATRTDSISKSEEEVT